MKDPTGGIILQFFLICLGMGLVAGIVVGIPLGILFGLIPFGIFILQGLTRIPADPPHVGLVTEWGERTEFIKREGIRLLPLRGLWYNAIRVLVKAENLDLPPQTLTIPDGSKLKGPLSFTWYPEKKNGKELVAYLNTVGESGKRDTMNNILKDIAMERLREWASSNKEGPKTWRDAIGSSFEGTAIIAKAILGDEIGEVSSPVPTTVLFRYFVPGRPIPTRVNLTKQEVKQFGAELNQLEVNAAELEALRQQVEARRTAVKKLRQGKGEFKKPELGIIITRINLGEIEEVAGDKIVEADKDRQKEIHEREAQKVEIEHLRDRAREIKTDFPQLTDELALMIAQVQLEKVKRDVLDRNFGVQPALLTAILKYLDRRGK